MIRLTTVRLAGIVALAAGAALAQTAIDLRTQSKSVDFSAAANTKPAKTGSALPSSCQTGEMFFKTGAPAGSNIYGCVSTNTWALQAGGGSGSTPSPNYTQSFTSQTQVTLTHSLNSTAVLVACYDTSTPPKFFEWDTLSLTDANNAVVGFSTAQSGSCVVNAGSGGAGTGGGSGSVTSVGLSVPSEFSVSGSPVTSAGTLAVSKTNQSANLVYAGPSTGSAAAPGFRSLVSADLPNPASTAGGKVQSRTCTTGNFVSSINTDSSVTCTAPPAGATGTVTSVALTVPAEFSVVGSPVTTSGTLAVTKATQQPNLLYAGPASGAADFPVFRSLVSADLPYPATSAGGKVQSRVCNNGDFVSAINTDSSITCTTAPSGTNSYSAGSGIAIAGGVISVDPASVPAYLNGMDTISFSSISNASCAAATFTLPGAFPGDAVAPRWPATLADGLFGAMLVTADDTVTVRLCNLSGSAVNPGTLSFGATIVRSF